MSPRPSCIVVLRGRMVWRSLAVSGWVAAIIARAAGEFLGRLSVEHARPGADGIILLGLCLELGDGTWRQRAHDVAILLPFAIDAVTLDHPCDLPVGPCLPGDQPFGPRLAQHGAQFGQAVVGEGWRTVAGIAARAAEA